MGFENRLLCTLFAIVKSASMHQEESSQTRPFTVIAEPIAFHNSFIL